MEVLGLEIGWFPLINALFNAGSAILLIFAYFFVRQRWISWHRASIIVALVCSGLFLISYLIYHAKVGHVPYGGTGWIRTLYFIILISHTVLAAIMLPMIVITLALAMRNHPQHPRLGRVTLPIWLYVSITGIVVFLMLRPYATEAHMHAATQVVLPHGH
jgi:putative membrane protein